MRQVCDFLIEGHRGKYSEESDQSKGGPIRDFIILGRPFFESFYIAFNYSSMQLRIAQSNISRGVILELNRGAITAQDQFFRGGTWVALGVSLACLVIFIYQLYLIIFKEKVLSSFTLSRPLKLAKARKVNDSN